MADLNAVRAAVYRANINRYRRLLQSPLTDLERQFIERRLSEERRALDGLQIVWGASQASPIDDSPRAQAAMSADA